MEEDVESGEPLATVVVVPRERHGLAVESLRTVLENTIVPFELVYVDCASPPSVQAQLAEQVAAAGGRLIRREAFRSPNAARNLALANLRTKYVAFVDNDVLVERGWLEALVRCAEETRAAVVGPLTLLRNAQGTWVHLAGGELTLEEREGRRNLEERHLHIMEPVEDVRARLSRRPCDFAEFHTLLIRRSVLEVLGPFDESLRSTAEHLDLALLLADRGETVFVEPASCVTYVQPDQLHLGDSALFQDRWSEGWNRSTFAHFARKWRLDPAGSFFRGNGSYLHDHQSLAPLPDRARVSGLRPAPITGHGYAQTPGQLYQQMRAGDWSDAALEHVRHACDAAVVLFSDLFRACGKPFLCHGIGTASILLRYGAPLRLVTAGLCHAAYSHGRFPARRRMRGLARRQWLMNRIGWAAESLVRRYHAFDWHAQPPSDDLEAIDCRDAGIMLLRMANDLEERLDYALVHTRKAAAELPDWQPLFRSLAERTGVPGLASELQRAMAVTGTDGGTHLIRSGRTMSYAVESWRRDLEPFDRREKRTRSWWRRALRGLAEPRS